MADIFTITADRTFLFATPGVVVLASNGAGEGTAAIGSLLPFLLIGLAFYFLLIRPQRKRQQEQKAMVSSLGVGDDVVTIGGMYGEIMDMTDDSVDLLIADEVVVTMARNAISRAQTLPTTVLDDQDLGDSPLDDDDYVVDDEYVVDDDGEFDDNELNQPDINDSALDDTDFDDTALDDTDFNDRSEGVRHDDLHDGDVIEGDTPDRDR